MRPLRRDKGSCGISAPIQTETALIEQLIQPETSLEKAILNDDAWRKGALWGEPRWGHPEGKVIYHIREVLDNVEALDVSSKMRERLRLITIIHDSFKYQEEQARPRTDWSKHHAAIARRFAEQFDIEPLVLDIIELHDEAYYAWNYFKYQLFDKAQKRLDTLQKRISCQDMQLYYLFFKCDTQTGDKTQAPVLWFEQRMNDIQLVQF